ncbi:MAG: hypothetical protein SNJ74_07610 [Fimbriimonadaceae bacterium]
MTDSERFGATLAITRIWRERFDCDTPFPRNAPPGCLSGGRIRPFGRADGDRSGGVGWLKPRPRVQAYADFDGTGPKNSWEIAESAICDPDASIRRFCGLRKPR